jgi:hypothetical protein
VPILTAVGAEGVEYLNKQPIILIKWNGCTPSTAIGTLFITVSISIEPTAAMRGILQVTPRGSW